MNAYELGYHSDYRRALQLQTKTYTQFDSRFAPKPQVGFEMRKMVKGMTQCSWKDMLMLIQP